MVIKCAVARLCLSVAKAVYQTAPPSPQYAEAVGRLLFGTACAESMLTWRRQLGLPYDCLVGAWGLWQTEHAAVTDSVRLLSQRPNLGERCLSWLEAQGVHHGWSVMNSDPLKLMSEIGRNDALACLLCRLHYLRFPSLVPIALAEQAGYWKRTYNTSAGAGTTAGYLEKWRAVGASSWEAVVESEGK